MLWRVASRAEVTVTPLAISDHSSGAQDKSLFFSLRVQRDICLEMLQLWAAGSLVWRYPLVDERRGNALRSGSILSCVGSPPSSSLPTPPLPCVVFNKKKNVEATFSRQGEISCFYSVCLIKCVVDCKTVATWLWAGNSGECQDRFLMHFYILQGNMFKAFSFLFSFFLNFFFLF